MSQHWPREVYFTKEFAVDHLLDQALEPALEPAPAGRGGPLGFFFSNTDPGGGDLSLNAQRSLTIQRQHSGVRALQQCRPCRIR